MDTSHCRHCGKALWQLKLSEKREFCSDRCRVAAHRAKKKPVKRVEIDFQPTLQGEGRFYLSDERGNVFGPSFGSLAEFQCKVQLVQLLEDPREPGAIIKPVSATSSKREANAPLEAQDEIPASCPFCGEFVPYSSHKTKRGEQLAHVRCVFEAQYPGKKWGLELPEAAVAAYHIKESEVRRLLLSAVAGKGTA